MKIIFTIAIFLSSLQICFAQSSTTNSKEEVDLMEVQKNKRDRSAGFASIDAFIYSDAGLLTVVGCELGDTYICIMDEYGNMCFTGAYYFGAVETEFSMEIPQSPGRYWLVIDSKALYAEGTFLINN